MLRAILAFFVLAVFALLVGATGMAGISIEIGRVVLVAFLVFAVVAVAIGLLKGRRPKDVL